MASAFESGNTSGRATGSRSLADQSSRVVSEVQELGRVALDSAGEAASNLKDKGRELLDQGRERATQAKSNFDEMVAANPMKSVLIAAGVGVALGYALSRRSRG